MSLPATSRRNLASYRGPCGAALCIVSPGEEYGASLALRIASASMWPAPEERQKTCLFRGSRAKRARPMSKHTRLVFSSFSTGVLALAVKHTSDDAAQSARWARHELFPSSKAQSLWRGECLLHSVCAPLREMHHSSVVSNVETVHYHSGAAHIRPKPDPPAFCCDPWLRVLTAYLSVCLSRLPAPLRQPDACPSSPTSKDLRSARSRVAWASSTSASRPPRRRRPGATSRFPPTGAPSSASPSSATESR